MNGARGVFVERARGVMDEAIDSTSVPRGDRTIVIVATFIMTPFLSAETKVL